MDVWEVWLQTSLLGLPLQPPTIQVQKPLPARLPSQLESFLGVFESDNPAVTGKRCLRANAFHPPRSPTSTHTIHDAAAGS